MPLLDDDQDPDAIPEQVFSTLILYIQLSIKYSY